MTRIAKTIFSLAVLALCFTMVDRPVQATGVIELTLTTVRWRTDGDNIIFDLGFWNMTSSAIGPAPGKIFAQTSYGAILDNGEVEVGTFMLPPLDPNILTAETVIIPRASLPPSAQKIFPSEAAPSGFTTQQTGGCVQDTFWSGNIHVTWEAGEFADRGGEDWSHKGTLQVCPGAGPSYIRVETDCAATANWNFLGLCGGWTADLVVDDNGIPGAQAANPLPAGPFVGWICLTPPAGAIEGDMCDLSLRITCPPRQDEIELTATACDWSGAVQVEPSSWGKVKAGYR